MNKKILLIITGSVAAYKAVELVRLLQKKSFEVSVILTKAAQEFVTPLLVSSIAKNKIYTELFSREEFDKMTHISLSRDNDLIVVAPASADFIAKMANGYGDDLASTVILAADKKIMFAPAMNEKMWDNQANQENIEKLISRGDLMIEPLSDELACGEVGVGKMAEPEQIADEIANYFKNKNKLAGKKILITGGGTREAIDPVRFIGNDSSGKQAIAIVKVLTQMGAEVKLIAANINQKIPLDNKNILKVKTADEMFLETKNNLDWCNVFIACAAVSDYKVKNSSKQKIKKENSKNLTLELEKNEDILEFVGHAPIRPSLVIGFAAESENLVEYAQEKLVKKQCDLIVANDIENGAIFGASNSHAYLVSEDNAKDLGKISKDAIAKIIADYIASK